MKLLFIILSSCMLFACTITKRQFNSGYHVEWKRTSQSPKERTVSDKEISLKDDLPEARSFTLSEDSVSENIAEDPIQIIEIKHSDAPPSPMKEEENFTQIQRKISLNQATKMEETLDEPVENDQKEKKVEVFTWFALGGILFGIFLVLISFLVSVPEILWGVIFGVGILVIIFSVVSVIRIIKNPERYKAKGLTWTLFGLSTAGIGAVLFMLIYFILLATNNIDLW